MDDSLELLKHSHKLLTLLHERRSQVCSPGDNVNGDSQEHQNSTGTPLDNEPHHQNKNGTGESITEKKNKTSFKTFPEPFSNSDRNWNWKPPRSEPSTPTETRLIGNSKKESYTPKEPAGKSAIIPVVTLSRDEDSWSKGQTTPVTQSRDMSIPTILIWPETQAEDTFEIDIADTSQSSSPQASNPPSPPLPPPPPPPRSVTDFENPIFFPQCEIEVEQEHSQKEFKGSEDKTGKEMVSFKDDENNKKQLKLGKKEEEEHVTLSMNGDVSSENDDSKPVAEDKEENVQGGNLLKSKPAPIRRRSVSPVSGNTYEKKPLVSILHRRSENTTTVSTNDLSDVDPEHPTIGKSLNSLADQTLLDNHLAPDEENCLGADLPFHETKKRRSFCDLLLEIPRKLSNVSDVDLGNVGPMFKRSLANRKARKQSKVQENEKKEEEKDKSLKDCFFIILSGMYGLIIVVLGAVIPISETFAEPEPPHFFDAFYIYLFTCSVLFIFYIYTFLLRRNKKNAGFKFALNRTFNRSWSFTSRFDKETAENRDDSWYRRKITTDLGPHNPNGSFYLRLGALGFGIGGMIHSGLLLGMHFQGIGGNSYCDSRIQAVKPLFHLIFTFTQLYFIFLNPKVCIHRYKTFARFGLMHMCGTNICVWFRNIVVETLHEMHREGHGGGHHSDEHHVTGGHGTKNLSHNVTTSTYVHILKENVTHAPAHELAVPSIKCYWTEMMGKVVERASPYLYPCSIEYSLICAGIMYVLWQQVGRGPILVRVDSKDEDKDHMDQMRHNRMSVDCGSSSRGLFVGILLFVMAVITMVAFYVLVNKENMTITALALVHLSEITIYLLGIIATLAAAWRMRGLAYRPGHASVLENVLIFISLTGVFIFCIFGIIAAIFHKESGLANVLSIASNLMMIIQSIIQTVFMVVASELSAFTSEDVKRKTGREFVTFLILCNLSLWGINTFETQRAEHNPIQTDFYGHMPWAILTHISVPLGIFYRFHSTVCLSNIWKNAWKDKKH